MIRQPRCVCPICSPSRWLVVALCALASACVTSAPAQTAAERAAGGAALQAWRESGLPEPTRCDFSSFAVRYPDASGFMRACRAMPDASAGCLLWDDERPIVTVSPLYRSNQGLLVHELQHALVRCAGIGPAGSPGDGQHTMPAVWKAAGGETSAQSRAMRLLGE